MISKKDEHEMIDAISLINGDLYEIDEEIVITLRTDGASYIIDFCGYNLWFSEDDDRGYHEEEDVFEEFEPFIKRKINEFLRLANSIPFTDGCQCLKNALRANELREAMKSLDKRLYKIIEEPDKNATKHWHEMRQIVKSALEM